MTFAQAILNILDTTPRPVPAEVVLAFLPGFHDAPELTRVKDKAARIALVTEQLEFLQAVDEVTAIPDHHAGRLWKITPNGKAAIK